jgi:hypothetical protein
VGRGIAGPRAGQAGRDWASAGLLFPLFLNSFLFSFLNSFSKQALKQNNHNKNRTYKKTFMHQHESKFMFLIYGEF